VFENLRARLDRFLSDHSRPDARARAAALREALLEAKVGVGTMQSALTATERELEGERRQLADAERRGKLAAEVPDAKTVALAERFAVRHRERVAVLERKLVVLRDELVLAEREVAEILAEYRAARRGSSDSIEAAWRDLEAAGGERPGTGLEDEPAMERDRKLKEAVEAQLAYLKKKMGRQP
jgi:septal ring factor EnvC (AmiA/AmiB activator)